MKYYFLSVISLFLLLTHSSNLVAVLGNPANPPELEEKEASPCEDANFYAGLGDIRYSNLVSLLKKQADAANGAAYRELYELATKPKETQNGLMINYLQPHAPFLTPINKDLLFHGTRSALDILASWKLTASQSTTEWGIYFGEDYPTAYKYTTSHSSSRGLARPGVPTRAVLVLSKDPKKWFMTSHNKSSGYIYPDEYLLAENFYSLDHLLKIIFQTEHDVQSFSGFFDKLDGPSKKRLQAVELYQGDYLPLKDRASAQQFCELLNRSRQMLASNTKLLAESIAFELLPWTFSLAELAQRMGKEGFNNLIKKHENDFAHRIDNDQGDLRDKIRILGLLPDRFAQPYLGERIIKEEHRPIAQKAVRAGDLATIKFIVHHAPNLLRITDWHGSTPSDEAAHSFELPILKAIATSYPDTLNIKNRWGWTPAATAANQCNLDAVNYLATHHRPVVESDMPNVIERSVVHAYTGGKCEKVLFYIAEQFPKEIPEILKKISEWPKTPPAIVQKLKAMQAQPAEQAALGF